MQLCGRILCCWLFIAILAVHSEKLAAGQEAAQDKKAAPDIRARANLVLVPALVQDAQGELVYSLTADDFIVTDNGVEQKLRIEEEMTPPPLALVVVLENGRSGPRQFEYLRGLSTMMENIVGEGPVRAALITFDSKPKLVAGFAPSLDPVREAMKRPTYGDNGSAVFDAVDAALKMLDRQPRQYRRALLLVSETRDHGSQISREDLIRDIGASNTAIYSVAFSPAKTQLRDELAHGGHTNKPYNLSVFLPPVVAYFNLTPVLNMAANGMRENAAEEMAGLSGGEYIRFDNQKEFDRSLNTIANHFPNRYLLSFQPIAPQMGLHPLTVRVKNHPDYQVKARTGYWAGEDTQNPPSR